MKFPLSGTDWQFKQIAAGASALELDAAGWMAATVPGVTHTDLLANGKIAEPFYGDNEKSVQWVGQADWVYRRTFEIPAQAMADQTVELVCDGLDTVATLYLNGQKIGTSENMFYQQRFDIRTAARTGNNELVIHFASPERISTERQKQFGLIPATEDDRRVWLRKAQCHFGWDWGPRFLTSGIWRDIRIESASHASIELVHCVVPYADSEQAIVEVAVNLRRHKKQEPGGKFHLDLNQAALELQIILSHETSAFETQRHIAMAALDTSVKMRFEVAHPKLWWPRGYGRPELYKVSAVLLHDGQVMDVQSHEIGLRTVKLIQELDGPADKQVIDNMGRKGVPQSFIFSINGTKVFCRGANWIPADAFLPRVTPQRYEELVERAADAHMNMLRVWGGGVYEDDAFYAACDRHGVMVWQDFMFACAYYPEEPWFLDQIKSEAAAAIQRLWNHPSIVLWCGNNENHQARNDHWFWNREIPARRDRWGEPIYHQILPEICGKLDPSRPYWPGSPWSPSSTNPLYALDGDYHRWDVWSNHAPAEKYRDDQSRFMSEFGFQALPTYPALVKCTAPEDRTLNSPIMTHHNKQADGMGRLRKYADQMFNVPAEDDLRSWVYVTQVVQARSVQIGVDHWRSQKFHSSGCLFWQHNDCWPVASWSCLDYPNGAKALYYYAKRFFAPIRVLLIPRGDKLHASLVNDTREAIGGILTWTLFQSTGETLWCQDKSVDVEPNGIIHLPPVRAFANGDPRAAFYHLKFERAGDFPRTETYYFGVPDKNFQVPVSKSKFSIHMSEETDTHNCSGRIKITAETLVRDLFFYMQDAASAEYVEFGDNFLTLLPGDIREIPFKGNMLAGHLRLMNTHQFSRQ